MIKRTLDSWLNLALGRSSPSQRRAASSRRIKCFRPSLDLLEDRRLLSVATAGDETAQVAAPLDDDAAEIIGRHVFYNNSRYDERDPAPTVADDAAIAIDKQALLPGQSATFANYTSYVSGINGVMVDVDGLAGVPTLSDFVFRVGNSDSPDSWAAAPAPIGFDARPGGGIDGSTRIAFTWADGTIKNEWLQVVVRATSNTGLTQSDIFYFGNAVGETGNHALDAYTSAADRVAVRANPHGLTDLAGITSAYDFNRDGLVNASDELIAQRAYNGQGGLLWLITPDSNESQPQAAPQNVAAAPESSAVAPLFVDFVSADVVGRRVFYNNSQFDGTNPLANAGDDWAIATDKVALLPGASAAAENYTNYSRGLNGIMIDIAGLPGTPTAGDFEFRTGPAGDPSSWTLAPQPMTITVRHRAGVDGSDRVTVIWPDNVIENGWLQVTVKAAPNTGLSQPDVFYFGNLIGDTGTTAVVPIVTAADRIATRGSQYSLANPAPITAVADFDRDSLVNDADESIATRHIGMPVFRLITAPLVDPTVEAALPPADFVHWGDAGYRSAYAPTLVRTPDGTILYFSEGRSQTSNDASSHAVVMRRSVDDGVSWGPLETVYSEPPGGIRVGVPSAVVDEQTGAIHLMFTKDNSLVFVMSSADSGATWSTPVDITTNVKVTEQGNPNPDSYPDTPWGWYAVGTGHGIQLQNGPFAGRLLITADHRLSADLNSFSYSHVIYSDDHGQTWHLGGGLDQTNPLNDRTNENTIAEGSDGSIYMSIRLNGMESRGSSRSYDGGMTWTNKKIETSLKTSPVHASLLRINENTVLFSAPHALDGTGSVRGMRQAMTIWVSHDNMQTWQKGKTVFYGYASYSDMVLVGPDTVLLVFDGGRNNLDWVEHTYLTRVNLRWLESPDDYQFTWHFNEKSPGQLAELGGSSIIDSSPWDNRGVALASTAELAPTYVAGPNGHTALSFDTSFDRVMLTPPRTRALQFQADESFTVEAVLRTTDSSGTIVGVRDNVPGWSLKLSDGHLLFRVSALNEFSSVISPVSINDGLWHRIAAVRDAATSELALFIDGVKVASAADTSTKSLWSGDWVILGSDSGAANQLAFDVDVLRVTRHALAVDDQIPNDFAEPPRYPATIYPADAPNTIDGLQFWLPGYDRTRFFADQNFADPLPAAPQPGTAVHSAIDASGNEFHATMISDFRHVLYAEDPVVGPNWLHQAKSTSTGPPWLIADSNGASAKNFDFVQETGVFTISTFVKPGEFDGPQMTLFDTTSNSLNQNGFMVSIRPDGSIRLLVVGGEDSTVRVNETTQPGLLPDDGWYQLVVVGNGPDQPVSYYVTPVTESAVAGAHTGDTMSGPNGDSPSSHDLALGALADSFTLVFNGQTVDQAVFDRALDEAEIQQLFDYTKKD